MQSESSKNFNIEQGFCAKNAGNAFTLSVVFLLFFSIVLSIVMQVLKIDGDLAYFLNYLPAPLSVLTTLLVLCFRTNKNCFKLLKPKKIEPYSMVSALLIIVGLLFGLSKINDYFVTFLQNLGFQNNMPEFPSYSPKNLIFAIIFICVIPPITEEILMRKIMLDGLKEVGEFFAVIVGGAVFSLYHMNPAQTIYQFIVGMAFCYIVIKGGSYVVTALAHLFNNLFIVLNHYFFNLQFSPVAEIITMVLGLICIALGVFLLYKKGKKLERKVNKEPLKDFLIGAVLGITVCVFMWISTLVM